jgi:hypothetical protein
LQTCTPRCHPIPCPGLDVNTVPGASGMKQFVESSSIQGRLSGLARGARRPNSGLAHREGGLWSTRRKHKHKHAMGRRRRLLYTVPVSACRWQRRSPHLHLIPYGILPSVPVPGLGLVPAWKH